jgi:hypothetical protein
VSGHVRFDVIVDIIENSLTSALFVDPPRSVVGKIHSTDALLSPPPTVVTLTHGTDANITALPAVFAQFVQRDNWRNGAWINQYGSQGYSLFRNGIPYALPPESTIPDVMPPGVTYTMYAAYDQGLDPAVYTDPRLLQDPTRPGYTTKAIFYNGDPTRYAVFRFDDGLSHAVSLYQLDYDHEHARYTITVYDDATGTLLDGPREVGDYETTGVYMTWNVRGHIRFYSTPEVAYSYTSALFIDPPMSVGLVTHRTSTAISPPPVTVTVANYTDAYVARAIVTVTVTHLHGGRPWRADLNGPLFDAARRALATAFSREPVITGEGGSIPVVGDFQRILGTPVLLVGFGLPGENAHAPNEWMSEENFNKGMRAMAALWDELARG